MELLGFELANPEKVERAIFGMVADQGRLVGGVGEDASDEAKIAEYDRLGGLITQGDKKYKVKTGSFYDFKERKPRETPQVVLLFKDLNGEEVEVGADEEIPMEVRAAEMIKEKKGKGKKKAKPDVEGEDEE